MSPLRISGASSSLLLIAGSDCAFIFLQSAQGGCFCTGRFNSSLKEQVRKPGPLCSARGLGYFAVHLGWGKCSSCGPRSHISHLMRIALPTWYTRHAWHRRLHLDHILHMRQQSLTPAFLLSPHLHSQFVLLYVRALRSRFRDKPAVIAPIVASVFFALVASALW